MANKKKGEILAYIITGLGTFGALGIFIMIIIDIFYRLDYKTILDTKAFIVTSRICSMLILIDIICVGIATLVDKIKN